jgi:hypothetical protein
MALFRASCSQMRLDWSVNGLASLHKAVHGPELLVQKICPPILNCPFSQRYNSTTTSLLKEIRAYHRSREAII